MDVRVGLDFGTHQTKVCVNYQKKGQLPIYEFIDFGSHQSSNFFLPSKVNINGDGFINIGHDDNNPAKSFRYFKIASAEDEEFRGISGLREDKEHYDKRRYENYSPEILSIIFLCHVIGKVQTIFENTHKQTTTKPKKKSFMSRFLGGGKDDTQGEQEQQFNYHYQIGIPTEWSSKKNRWRRRKFEQILYIAKSIVDSETYSKLEAHTIDRFYEIIEEQYISLVKNLESIKWDKVIDKAQISAFPETAAGLTYLVKTGKIPEGYYLALDIGGGSSDISFFRVNSNHTFEYLASESLLIASNDVYSYYAAKKGFDTENGTEEAQNYLEGINAEDLCMDEVYRKAYTDTINRLKSKIKRIYNKRVYFRFKRAVANTKFKNQSCYLYGGGSLLVNPQKSSNHLMKEILLHDQGTQSLTATRTHARIDKILDFDVPHQVKPEGWKAHLPLLIVPLGLSYIQPENTYDWNETLYEAGEEHYRKDQEPGLYDLFRRRWV